MNSFHKLSAVILVSFWCSELFIEGAVAQVALSSVDACDQIFDYSPGMQIGDDQLLVVQSGRVQGCILEGKDTSATAISIRENLRAGQVDSGKLLVAISDVATDFKRYQNTTAIDCEPSALSNPSKLSTECLADWHLEDLSDLAFRLSIGNQDPDPNNWSEADGRYGRRGIDLTAYLDQFCNPVNPSSGEVACLKAFRFSVALVRSVDAAKEIVAYHYRNDYAEGRRKLLDRKMEWDAYLFKARSQYPWELFINGEIYQSSLCANHRSQDCKAGFPEPPKSQWIVMHPSAGVEYYEADGTAIKGSLIVELLGYNRWAWDKKSSKHKNMWGASAILSFSDAKNAETLGYGVMVHTPVKGISVAYTRRQSENGNIDGVFFNVDVAKLFQDKLDIVRSAFKDFGIGPNARGRQ